MSIHYVNSLRENKRLTRRVTRTPLKTEGELRCSGRVSSSCSTSDTRHVNLVKNPVIIHERGKDQEMFTTSGTYPWSFVTQAIVLSVLLRYTDCPFGIFKLFILMFELRNILAEHCQMINCVIFISPSLLLQNQKMYEYECRLDLVKFVVTL
jgi:hypothetical protein